MASRPVALNSTAVLVPRVRTNRLWIAYGALGSLLTAYLVWKLVRPAGSDQPLVDGWGVDAFEFVVAGLCIARGFVRQSRRGVPLALGFALLSWCLGDVALTIESLGGKTPPVPSVADVFYLGFYPLAYVGVVLFMRRELQRLTAPSWLDGAVAGLGAAAVCAAFAFHSVVHSAGGTRLSAAVNLAYPIGDLLLLALVVGGTAVLPGLRKAPWMLLAGACSLNAVGDTFNLFGSSIGSTWLARSSTPSPGRAPSCSCPQPFGCAPGLPTPSPRRSRPVSSCREWRRRPDWRSC